MAPGAASRTEPVYKLGEGALEIPMELHKVNRARLCDRLRNLWHNHAAPTNSLEGIFVLLQGGTAVFHGGSDVELNFRQVLKSFSYLL